MALVMIGSVAGYGNPWGMYPPMTYSEYNPTPYGGYSMSPYTGPIYYGPQDTQYYNVYDNYGLPYGSAAYNYNSEQWGSNYLGQHNYGYSSHNPYYQWGTYWR